MSDWTTKGPEAAREYLKGRRLDEVECIISDLPGIARGKAVPASKFARQDYFHLPDSIFYQTLTGGWGEAAGDVASSKKTWFCDQTGRPRRPRLGPATGHFK
jgi:glutamine synthetase